MGVEVVVKGEGLSETAFTHCLEPDLPRLGTGTKSPAGNGGGNRPKSRGAWYSRPGYGDDCEGNGDDCEGNGDDPPTGGSGGGGGNGDDPPTGGSGGGGGTGGGNRAKSRGAWYSRPGYGEDCEGNGNDPPRGGSGGGGGSGKGGQIIGY